MDRRRAARSLLKGRAAPPLKRAISAQDPLHIGAPLFEGNAPSAAALAAVQAHRRFADSIHGIAAGLLALYRDDKSINSVVTDRWRNLISIFAVHLQHADPSGSGFTAAQMRALCVEHNICSPGRAEATLAQMRQFKYLETMPNADDRRLRRLAPTELLMARHVGHHSAIFRAMTLVLPEGAQALAALRSPAFMPAFMCRLARTYLDGFYYVNHVPDLRLFFERNAGMLVLYTLFVSAGATDSFPPAGPVSLSLSRTARGFGVSRPHVRRLLNDAVASGCLERVGAERATFHTHTRLRDALRRVLGICILHNAHCVRTTLASVESGR